jgi:hypothetical protein
MHISNILLTLTVACLSIANSAPLPTASETTPADVSVNTEAVAVSLDATQRPLAQEPVEGVSVDSSLAETFGDANSDAEIEGVLLI